MEEFKPADLHVIRDLEAAKAITDPLRLQIIEVLLTRSLTVNQIAKKLGLAASRLYYHVNTLEKHDLIRVVETTIHGNLIEKHYRVTAYNYSVDPEIYNFNVLKSGGVENLIAMALNHLDIVREDFARSIEARAFNLKHGAEPHLRRVIQSRAVLRISDEQIDDFQSRLQDLLKEFEALDEPENPNYQPWAFTVFLYPTFYYDQPDSEA
jgi:AcrR family transcriptional regulator